MNGRSEICVCGHDRDTHFQDQERPGEHAPGAEPKKFRGACLGLHCDDCKRFRPVNEPARRYKGSGLVVELPVDADI